MKIKIHLSGMAVMPTMLMILAGGCASSSTSQPAETIIKSTMGTLNEFSPLAPAEARNVRKVGNQWMCDINGQVMVYNDATGKWEPKH